MPEDRFAILIIEDDLNDVLLMKRALAKSGVDNPVHVVPDGEKAIEYLTGKGQFSDREANPFPGLILTDLKMPRMSGIEVLKWLKNNPTYKVVPTIVLTSSMEKADILQAYFYGANSYLVKPGNFEDLQKMMRTIVDYWYLCRVAMPEIFAGGPER
jgi:CheY-like chemotaxis protein